MRRSLNYFFFFLMIRRPPRSTLFPLHDALPILLKRVLGLGGSSSRISRKHSSSATARHRLRLIREEDRKSTRLNSSHLVISYAVFCLKKKKRRVSACDCEHAIGSCAHRISASRL